MEAEENIVASGTVIGGKYEIGRVIGSGGMGTVYEAVQTDLNRKVAIKLLRPRYAKSPKIINRFHQEARLAGCIDHDNICRVTDHGTDESGVPYLVMPLLSGCSLADMLALKQALSQMRVIDIACQTLSALEAAHQEKIVHRDLKPDNIFVTRMGDREDFVKLLDFGISKVLEKESSTALTSTGMVLGTAYYLAPEQARGARHIDHRVDIFAMGVILYEALTGRRPFEGETYNEVVFKIAGEPVKRPRLLNPSISKAVEQVILKAMAIDPNLRFSSAAEMCNALEQAVVSDEDTHGTELSNTLADTLADTDPDAKAKKASGGSSLFFFIIAGVVLAGAGALYVHLRRSAAPNDRALPAKVELKTEAEKPVAPIQPSQKPQSAEASPRVTVAPGPSSLSDSHDAAAAEAKKDTDSTVEDNATSKNDSSAARQKKEHAPREASAEKPPRKKSRSSNKPPKEDVIKGKFNTTFVFEDD